MIGLELATVYLALGSRVVIVELLAQLLAGVDRDLVRPLETRLRERCERVLLETRVASIEAEPRRPARHARGRRRRPRALRPRARRGRPPPEQRRDRRRRARRARSTRAASSRVDAQLRTNVPHVFAIGDVTGPPLLAHRAMHQGKVAAEVVAGLAAAFDARAMPSVAYTDPEVAWVGAHRERGARARASRCGRRCSPGARAAARSASGRGEGLTKLLFAEERRAPRSAPASSARTRAS